MLGYESIVIKTKIIVSSIIRVKNLPLKNANICTNAAVFVGVDTRNTHFLLVIYEKSTANTQARAFAINSFIPSATLNTA